ncbi:prepilin-type N-terminal cleavage/methylation domain-containing protein [Pseudofrancisella aestuarii]|uniref:Prepilin-type N-terminal cleavage/methylation domain-containing protein n=1 Tax=Pseudofrancisella aestuarii TaxID=2670347 RepID=A0ABV9TBP2_9GAMM|nr:pilin [Pseudofrancisella aestuarii]
MLKGQKGFSLIETMIIIGILAIVAAIAIPLYISYMNRAKATEVHEALRVCNNHVSEYYSLHGKLPNSNDDIGVTEPFTSSYIDSVNILENGFIKIHTTINGGETLIFAPAS